MAKTNWKRARFAMGVTGLMMVAMLMQFGCGGSIATSPKLKSPTTIDGNVSMKFPSKPLKDTSEGQVRWNWGGESKKAKIASVMFVDEELNMQFRADAMEIESLDETDLENLLIREFGQDWESTAKSKTLSNGTFVCLALEGGYRGDSISVVMVPGKKIYVATVRYLGKIALPTPEQLNVELAFHQSLKLNGRHVVDFKDAKSLFNKRQEEIQARLDEIEESEKKSAERQQRYEQQQAENAQKAEERRKIAEENRKAQREELAARVQSDREEGRSEGRMGPGRRIIFDRPAPSFGDNESSEQTPPENVPMEATIVTRESPSREEVMQRLAERRNREPALRENMPSQNATPQSNMSPRQGTSLGGSRMGTAFTATTPDSTVLVGFAVTFKKWGNNDCVESIQPLYRSLDGSKSTKGTVYGNAKGESAMLAAPKGYAVSGLTGRSGAVVDGFELEYMKVNADGTLDKSDIKKSDWIGNNEPFQRTTIQGNGKAVSEVKGYTDQYLSSVELVF